MSIWDTIKNMGKGALSALNPLQPFYKFGQILGDAYTYGEKLGTKYPGFTATAPLTTPSGTKPKDTPTSFDGGAWLADFQKQLDSLNKPNIVPAYNKTPDNFYNDTATRSEAEKRAAGEYNTELGSANEQFGIQLRIAGENYDIGSKLETDAMTRFLEQSGLTKVRSMEDLTSELGSLEAQRGEARASTAYGRVRQIRSLVDELSSKGLQYGGMANQAGREASQDRSLAKKTMERTYKEAVSGANTQNKRTGEDLIAKEADRKAQNEATIADLLLTKQRAVEDIASRQKQVTQSLDLERRNKIENAVSAAKDSAFQQWEIGLSQHKASYGLGG